MTIISHETQHNWLELMNKAESFETSMEKIRVEYDLTAPQAYNILRRLKQDGYARADLSLLDGKARRI